MALIKCRECGKEVSTSAQNCPNCGAPVKKPGIGCGGVILILFAVFFIIGSIVNHYRTITSVQPELRLSDDGYKWVDASYHAKLEVCKQLSMKTDKNYEWWYVNLDAFYSVAFEEEFEEEGEGNEFILSQKIEDVASVLLTWDLLGIN